MKSIFRHDHKVKAEALNQVINNSWQQGPRQSSEKKQILHFIKFYKYCDVFASLSTAQQLFSFISYIHKFLGYKRCVVTDQSQRLWKVENF